MKKICSISIDLDTLHLYHQIHGLPYRHRMQADPTYTLGLQRFLHLFDEFGIKSTLFIVGRDLKNKGHCEQLKMAFQNGHELANHTYSHPYQLTRLPYPEIVDEINKAEEAINGILPANNMIKGFRSPGYNVNASILEILKKKGYLYDSSIFSCPIYYLAKGLILAKQILQKRPSQSMLGSPRIMWAPKHPYHPGSDPYSRLKSHSSSFWELPMSLTTPFRLPVIGTSFLLYPRQTLRPIISLMKRETFLNIEFHSIDLLDPKIDPSLSMLSKYQPDLSISLEEKMRRFRMIFSQIAQSHQFVTLEQATSILSAKTTEKWRL